MTPAGPDLPTERRVFLANVGANAGHRFTSPIFDDGTFEFLPIPEHPPVKGHHAVRYRDLAPHNGHVPDLLPYVPARLWDAPAHNDPEFDTLTYGDNCSVSPRAAALRGLEPGDVLLFLAHLRLWAGSRPAGAHGFYLVGFLDVEEVLAEVTSRPSEEVLARFGNNAHVRRGLSDPGLWDRFWAFRGSARSRRFDRAVPVTRGLADRVFTRADGSPWRWARRRSDLQVIGSHTRCCRCVLDPARPGHAPRARALWDWVAAHDG